MNKAALANGFGKIKNIWKTYAYLRLLVYIVATSLVLYWQFIFGDKTFVFLDDAGDTYHQYLKVYEFFASSIKSGELTSYTFQYGFGNSIFSMISCVSDPFSLLGVLTGIILGQEYIYDSMIYILILKHICAGLICFRFIREFNFSSKSSMTAAYIYAFNGYITTLGEHYFFANNPIYLILILWVLEKVIKGEYKVRYWCGLLYITSLVTFAGATSAYEILLTAGFYALFRVIYIYGKDIKSIFRRLGISLALVICGVAISSFIFFPVLEKISGSGRVSPSGNIAEYFALSDLDAITSCIMRLFSNQIEGTFNSWYGSHDYYPNIFSCFFSVLLVPVAVQFVYRTFKDHFSVKDKIFRMIPIAVVLFFIFDKFIPYLMSVFVWHYQSYAYIFLPMYAVMFADVIDNIKKGVFGRVANCLTIIVSMALVIYGGVSAYIRGSETSFMWIMFVLAMLLFGGFALDFLYLSSINSSDISCKKKICNTAAVILTVVIVFDMFCENYVTTYFGRNPISKETCHTPMITTDIVNSVNNQEKENFFRMETNYYEGRMLWLSYPLMYPMRATAYYDSALDNDVPMFYYKMLGTSVPALANWWLYKSKADNNILVDLFGIKYLLCASSSPRSGWEEIENYPEYGVFLYKNTGIDSASLLFDSYVTQEDADNMSFTDRALGMAERLVIDAPPENINEFASEYSKEDDVNDAIHRISYDGAEFQAKVINADSIQPYYGIVDRISETNGGYNVKAAMDGEDSNFSFLLNEDIIDNDDTLTQITFELNNSDDIKSFVYFDTDNCWKGVNNLNTDILSGKARYTFVIPKTARALALCVKEACDIDVDISTETFDVSDSLININAFMPWNGTIRSAVVKNNCYNVKASLTANDSNINFAINTNIVNNSKNSVKISFRLKNDGVNKSFVYFDTDNIWKGVPEIQPEIDGEEAVYSFIIPQTALGLALCVDQPCDLDVKISTKTATAAYVNEGIHLDNPKRGNIINGTVEAEKNCLLYLPVPYNKHWNAYVDGEKVEILEANYAFMAVPITVGEHHVDFIYSNKTYHIFLKVSIMAFVLTNGFFIVYAIVRRKNKGKKESKA